MGNVANVVFGYIGCGIGFGLTSPVWLIFVLLAFITQSNIFLGPPTNAWDSCMATATNSTTAPFQDDGNGGGRRHHHHLRFLLEENNGAAPQWDHEESPRPLAWIQPIATTMAAVASDGGEGKKE
jgi:hypothetical protein